MCMCARGACVCMYIGSVRRSAQRRKTMERHVRKGKGALLRSEELAFFQPEAVPTCNLDMQGVSKALPCTIHFWAASRSSASARFSLAHWGEEMQSHAQPLPL